MANKLLVERDIIFYALRYALSIDEEASFINVFNNIKENLQLFSKDDISWILKEINDDFYGESLKLLFFKECLTEILSSYDDKNRIRGKEYLVESSILLYALNYSLGRMTFAPTTVMDNIKTNIKLISKDDITMFLAQINNCYNYGMECDKNEWLSFKDYIQKQLDYNNNEIQLSDLVKAGTLNSKMVNLLTQYIESDKNIIVCGKFFSGKTTVLRCLNGIKKDNKNYFKELHESEMNCNNVFPGDIIVTMTNYMDGRRIMSSISEVVGFKNNEVLLNYIFKYNYQNNSFIETDIKPITEING